MKSGSKLEDLSWSGIGNDRKEPLGLLLMKGLRRGAGRQAFVRRNGVGFCR